MYTKLRSKNLYNIPFNDNKKIENFKKSKM